MTFTLTQTELDCLDNDHLTLSNFSPNDAVYSISKRFTSDLMYQLQNEIDSHKYEQINKCGFQINFTSGTNQETGEIKHRIVNLNSCKDRILCLNCNRLSIFKRRKNLVKIAPALKIVNPDIRYIFLTYSLKTCHVSQLKTDIQRLKNMLNKLKKTYEWKSLQAIGTVMTIEVTTNPTNLRQHPHAHVIIAIKNSDYFNNIINQNKWEQLLKKAAKVNYYPRTWIQAIPLEEDPRHTASYLFKYAVKPQEFTNNPSLLFKISQQLKGVRLVATTGIFAEYKQSFDEPNIDDLGISHDKITNREYSVFEWSRLKKNHFLTRCISLGSTDDEDVNYCPNTVNSE